MKSPNVKTILYSELITDEPTQIQNHDLNFYSTEVSSIIPPRNGKFPGIYFDKNVEGNRLRTILNSDSLMFLIILKREKGRNTEFIPVLDNFVIIGSIIYETTCDQESLFAEFVSNYIPNSMISIDRERGGLIQKHPDLDIEAALQKNSVYSKTSSHIVFLLKRSYWRIEFIKYSEIPPFLVTDVTRKIYDMITEYK